MARIRERGSTAILSSTTGTDGQGGETEMTAQAIDTNRRKLLVGDPARWPRVPADRTLVDGIRLLVCIGLAVMSLAGLAGMGLGMGAGVLPAGGPTPGWP
jgi:hypothetical protein